MALCLWKVEIDNGDGDGENSDEDKVETPLDGMESYGCYRHVSSCDTTSGGATRTDVDVEAVGKERSAEEDGHALATHAVWKDFDGIRQGETAKLRLVSG